MTARVFTPYLYMELGFSVSNSSREPRHKLRSKILPATMLTIGTENSELPDRGQARNLDFQIKTQRLIFERGLPGR